MPVDMQLFKDLIQRYEWPKAVAVTGALGSGKTEWVLNLALGLKMVEEKVTIADADIINPYFCIRQVVTALENKGFTVLTAPGQAKWADMPVVSAEVDWALSSPGKLMLDIGGEAVSEAHHSGGVSACACCERFSSSDVHRGED